MSSKLKDKILSFSEKMKFAPLNFEGGEPILKEAEKEVREIFSTITPVEIPNSKDLTDIYDSIVRHYKAHGDLRTIRIRYLRQSPWLVFEHLDENRNALIQHKNLNNILFKEYKRRIDTRTILTLAHVFLRNYPKDKAYFDVIQNYIAHCIKNLDSMRGRRFAEKCEKYELFSATGPDKVATLIELKKDPVEETLIEAGLSGGCLQEGFVEEVYGKWLGSFAAILRNSEQPGTYEELIRLLEYSVREKKQHFPSKRVMLIHALLHPFRKVKPAKDVKEVIQEFLLNHFDDPRFNIGAWVGVDRDALNVIYGWLNEVVLNDFFRLLDYSSKYDEDADRQWRYRKAFWATCYRHGLIDNAWFALGKKVAKSAPYFLDSKKNVYAEISGPGVKGHHAVLILQMKNLVVTEWSHVGKYRFWMEQNRYCPQFYKYSYTREDVVTQPNMEGVHYSAKNGRWQMEVADYIRSELGYNLPYREYMSL